MDEPENVRRFKKWFTENGGQVHPHVRFEGVTSGFSVVAAEDIPPETTAISCPFSLAVTPELSKHALLTLFKTDHTTTLDAWSERQLICTYLCMHWVVDSPEDSSVLLHRPYLNTLPSADKLRTPLHFTQSELDALRGSNLYGATLDRQRELQAEWTQCQTVVSAANEEWGQRFIWEQYLTAATYLSSRAFPSTLLSPNPSLVATSTSYPVLLPGVDALNHARAQPVSWVVARVPKGSTASSDLAITLVLHAGTPRGRELLNNYGPKPNAELILGYGFALPANPDDTIVLKLGGASSAQSQSRWEVGRDARGAEPVWAAVLAAVTADADAIDIEDVFCAADVLGEMAQNLLKRLPQPLHADDAAGIRPDVAEMIGYYLEGQRDILQSLIQFAQEKERQAEEAAREQGVLEIVNEDVEE
ncbi:SET domain-containing protein [Obba rivulosa]|uniref:SET domain-containing protein n=1 Tax=Obba rivulosa TaxID=1052685 RepID=A0A8E2B324_9APHY|nr:SET domain-containing protein [Obba rivulosa]